MTTNSLCAASKSHGHWPPLFACSDGKLCICFRFFPNSVFFSFHVSEFHFFFFFPTSALFFTVTFLLLLLFVCFSLVFCGSSQPNTNISYIIRFSRVDRTLLNGQFGCFPTLAAPLTCLFCLRSGQELQRRQGPPGLPGSLPIRLQCSFHRSTLIQHLQETPNHFTSKSFPPRQL